MTTTTVLDRLRDSADQSAWCSFVERFRGPVASFAHRLGLSFSDAEDIAQETLVAFLESYRNNAYERGRGRLSQYLFGIAHNKILVAQRKMARRAAEVSLGDGTSFWNQAPGAMTPEQTWDDEWQQSVLRRCLEQVRGEVTEQTFEAFKRVVFDEEDPAIVAERLGMTRNAVFIAKHRVGTRLRGLRTAFDEE